MEDFIKTGEVSGQNTQSADRITEVWCSASLNHWEAGVERRQRHYCGWRQRKLLYSQKPSGCFCSSGRRKVRKLGHTHAKCVTATSHTWMPTSSVFCFNVCHICLCHAMPCICAAVTRLISLLLAEWIKKTHIHCFSCVVLSPFHAVIWAKGRIKAALPRSQPSLFRLVKEEKLGGHACFGSEGLRDSLSGESPGIIHYIFWKATQSRGCCKVLCRFFHFHVSLHTTWCVQFEYNIRRPEVTNVKYTEQHQTIWGVYIFPSCLVIDLMVFWNLFNCPRLTLYSRGSCQHDVRRLPWLLIKVSALRLHHSRLPVRPCPSNKNTSWSRHVTSATPKG